MARKSIHIPGFKHTNPIPNAAVIGNILESGLINGTDPETGKMAEGFEAQVKHAFGHMKAIVEEAGGSTDDILKVSVWLNDPSNRAAVNEEWLKMFPDEHARPARHTMPGALTGPTLIHLSITAVLNSGS